MKKVFLLASFLLVACVPFIIAETNAGRNEPPPESREMAGSGGHGQDMESLMMEKGLSKALEDLKLTEEQEQKLNDIKNSSKREILVLRHEMQLAVLDIQDEYKKEKSDAARINAYIDKLSEAQKKMMKLRSDQMLKMKAVLTPDQFKKLIAKIEKPKTRAKKGFFDKLRGN